MILSMLMKRDGLRQLPVANDATAATGQENDTTTLTSVATVAVAKDLSDLRPIQARVVMQVSEGEQVRAVKIFSPFLGHLWLIIDRSFEPADGLAVYYAEELSDLASKSRYELLRIHKAKLGFSRMRRVQDGTGSR